MSKLDDPPLGRVLLSLGALAGATAVAAGAFGAHFLHEKLANSGHLDTWDTAVLYNLVHAAVVVAAAARTRVCRPAVGLWLVGILLFSGSLYIWSLGGPKWLVHITPFGGLALILGWVWFAANQLRGRARDGN